MNEELTQSEFVGALNYNPDTGIFTWKKARFGIRSDAIAGSVNKNGYIYVTVNGCRSTAHRLAWLYYYGKWPSKQIDHINGVRSDNRICNLRECSSRENHHNMQRHRAGKLLGACYMPNQRKKWQSRIRVNGKLIHLGYFETEQEAHGAYLKALSEVVS